MCGFLWDVVIFGSKYDKVFGHCYVIFLCVIVRDLKTESKANWYRCRGRPYTSHILWMCKSSFQIMFWFSRFEVTEKCTYTWFSPVINMYSNTNKIKSHIHSWNSPNHKLHMHTLMCVHTKKRTMQVKILDQIPLTKTARFPQLLLKNVKIGCKTNYIIITVNISTLYGINWDGQKPLFSIYIDLISNLLSK